VVTEKKMCDTLTMEEFRKLENSLSILERPMGECSLKDLIQVKNLQDGIPRMLFTIRALCEVLMKRDDFCGCDCGYREFSGKERQLGKDFCPDCGGPHVFGINRKNATLSDVLTALMTRIKKENK